MVGKLAGSNCSFAGRVTNMHCTGDLLDVSAGREMYGPGGGYSLLAGHDVTRCLATMSLAPRLQGTVRPYQTGSLETYRLK